VTPLAASTVRGIARACVEATPMRAGAPAASTVARDAAVAMKTARERENDRACAIETGREAGTKELMRRQRLKPAANALQASAVVKKDTSRGGSTPAAAAAAMQPEVRAVAAAIKTEAAAAVKVEPPSARACH